MYKLSGTLSGHEQDIKAIAKVNDVTIVSALRDSTVRLWSKPYENLPWSSAIESNIVYQAENRQFLNSLVVLPESKLIASGGIDGIINVTEEFSSTPVKVLVDGHTKNVCSLNVLPNDESLLISSSWDCTSIVWDLNTNSKKYVLSGHQASVWDAIFIDSENYLTGSADGTIRRWRGDAQVGEFRGGHTDVIRKLLLLPGGKQFASCSNDGNIVIWDLATKKVVKKFTSAHDSFIYDLALLPDGNLVSSGEDRSVRIWLLESGLAIQAITLPCISVWCVDTLTNGDIICGGSDNKIRVFTKTSERVANKAELQQFQESVQSSSIPEQSMDNLKKTDIPLKSVALQKQGKAEGSTIMVKSDETGIIEAHQWSGGEWVKIGDVVGGGGSGGKAKVEYLGAEYDYVFDVDIEDGKPPLKLPFNLNENPYEAASKFLALNELPSSYTNDVVNFIMQNTQGVELGGEPPKRYDDPYSDAYARNQKKNTTESAKKLLKLIPQKESIYFTDFKANILVKGLTKFNNEVQDSDTALTHKLTPLEISEVEASISSPDFNSKQALNIITLILPKVFQWPLQTSQLIGYDLLRVSVRKVTTVDILQSLDGAEIISSAIKKGLGAIKPEPSYIPLFMMILKVLNNLIGTTLFYQLYFTASDESGAKLEYSDDFKQVLNKINEIARSFSPFDDHKQYANTMLALSTFIYNLSILHLTNSGLAGSEKAAQPIVEFSNEVGDLPVEASSEAAYRMVIGYSNLKFGGVIWEENAEWLNICRILYIDSIQEKRFVELYEDVKQLWARE